MITATLTDGGGTRAVVVGDAWRRALLGARACYSYGALQSRLTENRELQEYLEELLVLGPGDRPDPRPAAGGASAGPLP